MCGRYTLTTSAEALRKRFGLEPKIPELKPRYNLAPGQEAPVVAQGAPKSLQLMRWGLVPWWAKDPSIGHKMINARGETLAHKSSFRRRLERGRCLVPADGFYEWGKARTAARKTPFLFHLKNKEPFALAGLWDSWQDPQDGILHTFTIITTQSNPLVGRLHDRMPVVLRPEHEAKWLDAKATDSTRLIPLLVPYPAELMEAQEVSHPTQLTLL